MAGNLDKFQRAAAETCDGSFLVIAGPGSGKTKTLIGRIEYLINNCKVRDDKICLVTFTRDAAEEMALRFKGNTSGEKNNVSFFTFHSLFFKILKEEMGYKNEDILMGREKKYFFKEAYLNSGIEKKWTNQLYDEISLDTSRFKNGKEKRENEGLKNEEFFSFLRSLDHLLKNKRKIDFDDMQKRAFELLSSNDCVLNRWRERYHYYMVDESQDMNKVQYEILKMLSIKRKNVLLVGDDDQSIYSFRGADPSVLLKFKEEYEGTKVLYLKKNYRSDKEIVNAAGQLIINNKNRFKKEFITESKEYGTVSYKSFDSERDEADDILNRILNKCKRKPDGTLALNESVGVLYRNNYEAYILKEKLKDLNIKNLSLHTFHGAKGLEYDTVFIINVNEGITPSKNAKTTEEKEEERRMFYVAMTRAKRRLYLYSVKKMNNTILYPSSYLLEIR